MHDEVCVLAGANPLAIPLPFHLLRDNLRQSARRNLSISAPETETRQMRKLAVIAPPLIRAPDPNQAMALRTPSEQSLIGPRSL